MLKALAAREVPIPDHIDMYLLDREMPASDKTALQVKGAAGVCICWTVGCAGWKVRIPGRMTGRVSATLWCSWVLIPASRDDAAAQM